MCDAILGRDAMRSSHETLWPNRCRPRTSNTTGFLNWVECANHARIRTIRDGVTTGFVATPTTWKRKHSGSLSLDCWKWLAANAPHACALSRNGSNAIERNYLGLDAATGTVARGNFQGGVSIENASNNLLSNNVISGNTNGDGIDIVSSSGNRIQGNKIGTTADGFMALANAGPGIYLASATGTVIGGASAGEGNVISGNSWHGIQLDFGSSSNTIQGNLIGTNASGTADLGNARYGILTAFSADNNVIGGTVVGARNVIAGNDFGGLLIDSDGNTIAGNYIGTDVTGLVGVSNDGDGIEIDGSNNTVGGTSPTARNVIAGNGIVGLGFGSGIGLYGGFFT